MEQPTTTLACKAAQAPALAPAPQPAAYRYKYPTSPQEYIQHLARVGADPERWAWIIDNKEVQDAYAVAAKAVKDANLPEDRRAEHCAWATPHELVGKVARARRRAEMTFWERAGVDFSDFSGDATLFLIVALVSPCIFCGVLLPRWWSAATAAMSAAAPEPLTSPQTGTTAGSDDANNSPSKSSASCVGGSNDGAHSDANSAGASSAGTSDDGSGTAAPAILQAEDHTAVGHVGTGDQGRDGLRWRLNANKANASGGSE